MSSQRRALVLPAFIVLTQLAGYSSAYTPGSCQGLCGSFAEGRDCFCDGYCLEKGDCCDDFEEVCDNVSRQVLRDHERP